MGTKKMGDHFPGITETERQLMVKSFAPLLEEKSSAGQKMVFLYLENWPTYKELWPQFRGVSDSHLFALVHTFADTFIEGLQSIMKSWSEPGKHPHTDELLLKMCSAHKEHQIADRHIMHLFEVFDEVMQDVSKEFYNAAVKQAWEKLFQEIATRHLAD